VLDLAPLFCALLDEGFSAKDGAELFHGTLIDALAAWIGGAAERLGHRGVALGGGCLMNAVSRRAFRDACANWGSNPFSREKIPCNDGGLSLGTGVSGARRFSGGEGMCLAIPARVIELLPTRWRASVSTVL